MTQKSALYFFSNRASALQEIIIKMKIKIMSEHHLNFETSDFMPHENNDYFVKHIHCTKDLSLATVKITWLNFSYVFASIYKCSIFHTSVYGVLGPSLSLETFRMWRGFLQKYENNLWASSWTKDNLWDFVKLLEWNRK